MKTRKTELWTPIKNYPDYEISSWGRLKSFKRASAGYIRKEIYGKAGYSKLILKNKGEKQETINAHVMVYDYYGEGKRNGRIIVVDHIDEDKSNNYIGNLQLLDHRANLSKSFKHIKKNCTGVKRIKSNKKKWSATITNNKEVYNLGTFLTQEEASKAYQDALSAIHNGTEIKTQTKDIRGVWLTNKAAKNPYYAQVSHNKKQYYLGCFVTESEAHDIYLEAKQLIKNKTPELINYIVKRKYNKHVQ